MPLLSTCLTLVPICGPEAAKPKNIVPTMINLFFHFMLEGLILLNKLLITLLLEFGKRKKLVFNFK